jgi:hypothetical protein
MGSNGASGAPLSRALLSAAQLADAPMMMAAPPPPPSVRREWAWDRRNAAGLVLSLIIGFVTGPGGGGGAQLYYPLFNVGVGWWCVVRRGRTGPRGGEGGRDTQAIHVALATTQKR